jgi:hypothetical protein
VGGFSIKNESKYLRKVVGDVIFGKLKPFLHVVLGQKGSLVTLVIPDASLL